MTNASWGAPVCISRDKQMGMKATSQMQHLSINDAGKVSVDTIKSNHRPSLCNGIEGRVLRLIHAHQSVCCSFDTASLSFDGGSFETISRHTSIVSP